MVRKRKCIIGILLVLCMVILQVQFAVSAQGTRSITVTNNESHGSISYSTNGTGDDANGTITMGQSFTIPNDATSIDIAINPEEGYRIDSESGIEIGGSKTKVNSENHIIYNQLDELDQTTSINVLIQFQSDNGGEQGGDQPNPGPGDESQSPISLYLVWNGGTQMIDVNTIENPENIFTVPSDCDFDSMNVYAISEGQVAGTNDLCLNKTNQANDTTQTVRSWHVTDYWQPPILDDDDPMNDHPITNYNVNCSITIVKQSSRPVSIDFPNGEKKADGWEFGNVQLTDLASATTKEKAVILETYYENSTIAIVDPFENGFQSIETVDIPQNAVTIQGAGTNSDPFSATINSDFYDTVLFKVTCNNGDVRYLKIVRKGIEIHLYTNNSGDTGYLSDTLHGTQPGCPIDWSDGTTTKIIATYYYDMSKTSTDFDMIATIKHQDGTIEMKVIAGIQGEETLCVGNGTKGGDYLIWSGNPANKPLSVSVTAVATGSFSGKVTQFTGASFGSGAGVSWKADNE